MTISIPFGAPPRETRSDSAGLRLNLPLALGPSGPLAGVPLGTVASAQVLAVVAAGVVDDPTDTLLLARMAREQPDQALVRRFDVAKITTILAAVRTAQDDSAMLLDAANSEQVAAASAVGAAPRLVVAASNAIRQIDKSSAVSTSDPTTTAGWSARRWAADLLDPAQLDRAARAVLRAAALEPLDAQDPGSLASRLGRAEKAIADLQPMVTTLRADVDALLGKGSATKR